MSTILKWYQRVLQFHPWKTQLLTTGFLMASGDVISQTLIERKNLTEVEGPRILRFGILGLCFVVNLFSCFLCAFYLMNTRAPVVRVWYNILERSFGSIGKTAGFKKMLCDQVVFVPCFLGSFLTIIAAVQFQPWHAIKSKVAEEYFTILKTNYMVWPGVQLITFYLIPLHMRVVFVSFIALFWNTYVASQANKNDKN